MHLFAVNGGLPYGWGNQNTATQQDLQICGRPLGPPVHGDGEVTSEGDHKSHYAEMPVTKNSPKEALKRGDVQKRRCPWTLPL